MLKETVEQKRERIFNFYKEELTKDNIECGQIRFNVIQYVCHFPGIDPFKMASVLISEGCDVVFDDSSITERENKKLKNQVMAYVRQ